MVTYPERYHALCDIIHDLPSPPGDEDNRFQLGAASGSNTRSYKLDHFVSTNKSIKGKEVERYAQVEQLRLSERDFENLGQIGDGQFGSVSAVRCKLDGQLYAMKTIKKFAAMRAGSQMNLPLERYIHTLAIEQGPAPEMVSAFQTDSTLSLVTTYAAHGSLWDRMCSLGEGGGETSQAGRMAENEIRWWGHQMVRAIDWLHGQGFVHRDIKPHNFLIHSPTRLTLTDFGSAASLIHPPPDANDPRPYVNKQQCLMPIGTPDYIAPEILKMAEDAMIDEFDSSDSDPDKTIRPGDMEPRGYGADVDWWSLGATVYEMSAGEAPFYARTVRETYELIMKCGEGAYQPATAGMSADLRSLLLSLLTASDIRLGTDPTSPVGAHPFFARDQHEDQPPQSVISLPLIEIGGRSDPTDTYEATFDHHFQSSIGMTTTLTSSCSSNQTTGTIQQSTPDRWCGWTWIPPPHAFSQPSSPTTSNRPMRPLPRQVPPVTPARSGASIAMPMTTPRSKVRSRPISDKRAMAELVKCVQHSARKRASSVKPRFPSQLESVGKEVWTPTPKPRPILVERDSKRNEVGGVEALVARQVKLEDRLTGLEKRFARLKTRLQSS